MCCTVDFNLFLCEEWHSQHGFGICEQSNKEIGRFFRGPILRRDIDPTVDLFFNQYTRGMKLSRVKGLGARKAQGSPLRDPNISI